MQKTVLITGANRGLGEALARTFREAEWRVLGTARDPSAIAPETVHAAHALDLSQIDNVHALSRAVINAGEKIDLLINNAGFNPKDRKGDPDYFASTFKIESFSAANVAESMAINALAPTELVSRLLPSLAPDAVVLNISSWLGSIGGKTSGGHYGYAGSKALLNMMTRALAMEWKETPRAAVALNPGWMQTDMGGAKAERTPKQTASDILDLYRCGALHTASGKFVNADGSEHLW
ncbi:MAG: SDR family NAD(P)-dependent oxidoreductase [Pseudomonadota bacterium]